MLKRWLIISLCAAGGLAGVVHAAEVQGLYESEIAVAGQSREEYVSAVTAALGEVLVKVSGRAGVAGHAGVATALRQSAALLQQYRYLDTAPVGTTSAGQRLWCRFDADAVNRLLRDNGLPVWGRTRPATLMWLAVQRDGQRFLVDASRVEEQALLTTEAARRGLALVQPLMDLEDQQKLTAADVWGGFQDTVIAASARYRAESTLIGRLDQINDHEWRARWTLLENQQVRDWDTLGATEAEALAGGMLGAMEHLASRYAAVLSSTASGALSLSVQDVRTLQDYARVRRYLESLEMVSSLQPAVIDSNRVVFALRLRGETGVLLQTIGLSRVLAAVDATAAEAAGQERVYRLLP